MAARRVSQSSINWTALSDRVPANQRNNFIVFKNKSDGYLRRMMANPEQPPKLDWTKYKQNIAVVGMVDNFQKSYESLNVPYPENKWNSLIDAQAKDIQAEIENFKKSSEVRISQYASEIEKIKALVPYEQMTMEEFCDAHPDKAIDALNRPTFWPHTPEEQLDYKPTDPLLQAKSEH